MKGLGKFIRTLGALCLIGIVVYKLYEKFTDDTNYVEFDDNESEDAYGFDFEADAEEKLENKIRMAANKVKSVISK